MKRSLSTVLTRLALHAGTALVVALILCPCAVAQEPRGGRSSPSDGGGAERRFGGGFPRDLERTLPVGDGNSLIRLEGGGVIDEDTVRTARETASHSTGTPPWSNPRGFEQDVFTFARVIFRSVSGGSGGRGFSGGGGFDGGRRGWSGWVNDYPDSDLNLSWRLQLLTSLRVDPDGRVIKLTSPDLLQFPFIYMVKPGRMELRPEEVTALRGYLLNGGALMTDDTWGQYEWENIEREMQRVLPGRNWIDLPKDHALFGCLFRLDKDKLQVPPIQRWERTGRSSRDGPDTEQAYFRAWLDDKGRLMVLSAHNTDLGDGWEREGENSEYFQTFSETKAYPFALNIVFYLMTH